MKLTPEEKKRIVEWMCEHPIGNVGEYYFETEDNVYVPVDFSLNDASLCVAELVKQGGLDEYYQIAMRTYSLASFPKGTKQQDCYAWLMTMQDGEATNFFTALAEFIKEGK
jgi:hypothetical protein